MQKPSYCGLIVKGPFKELHACHSQPLATIVSESHGTVQAATFPGPGSKLRSPYR